MKIRLPKSSYNWISLLGATIAVITLFMIVFLFIASTFIKQSSSYLGLVIYIILPGIMIAGLLVIPIGMYVKTRRDKKRLLTSERKWPLFDMNELRHRNAFWVFSIGTTFLLFVSAIGSYQAFHFTESDEFCGTICHAEMKPEYVAYANSPHARVGCVQCHVGEGADWYVRSKISGMYQLYAVTLGEVPKPIETPIRNLRPARETCERCHWPQKFYAHKIRQEKHFITDEENTEWNIDLVMKIGANHSALGLQEGIHWHINKNVKIEYVAEDFEREVIPWVKYTNLETGEVSVFQDADNPLDEESLDTLEVRTMDCMDCHTRPSHNYRPPSIFVNNAMIRGDIPKELPEFKALSMEICGEDYATTDSAMLAIETKVNEFYQENYPELYDSNKAAIDKAIKGFQDEYSKNIFPEMKVKWSAYPNHIGHLEFNGCFRCHDDNHVNESEKVISRDCNLCHHISSQGNPDEMEYARVGETLEFKHPVDIEGIWQESNCIDCHTGLDP